jgi:hypothetical protein
MARAPASPCGWSWCVSLALEFYSTSLKLPVFLHQSARLILFIFSARLVLVRCQEIVDAAAATYNVAIVADTPSDAASVHSDDANHVVAAVAESYAVAARAFLSRHSRAALSAWRSDHAILDDADAEALRAQAAKWGVKIIGVTHGALHLSAHLLMHYTLHIPASCSFFVQPLSLIVQRLYSITTARRIRSHQTNL